MQWRTPSCYVTSRHFMLCHVLCYMCGGVMQGNVAWPGSFPQFSPHGAESTWFVAQRCCGGPGCFLTWLSLWWTGWCPGPWLNVGMRWTKMTCESLWIHVFRVEVAEKCSEFFCLRLISCQWCVSVPFFGAGRRWVCSPQALSCPCWERQCRQPCRHCNALREFQAPVS